MKPRLLQCWLIYAQYHGVVAKAFANVLRVDKQVNPSIITWDITYDRT